MYRIYFALCMRITKSANGKINTKQIKWRSSKKTWRQTQTKLERMRLCACVRVFVETRWWADENNNKTVHINREQVNARMLSFFHPLICCSLSVFASFPYRVYRMSERAVSSLPLARSFFHSLHRVSPWAQVKSSTKWVEIQWSGHTQCGRAFI